MRAMLLGQMLIMVMLMPRSAFEAINMCEACLSTIGIWGCTWGHVGSGLLCD